MTVNGRAIILSLVFLVYLAEYAITPARVCASAIRVCSSPTGTCCGAQSCQQSHPVSSPCRPEKKDNPKCDWCLNCPLCCTTLLPQIGEFPRPNVNMAIDYSIFRSTYTYQYYSSSWKPPNEA